MLILKVICQKKIGALRLPPNAPYLLNDKQKEFIKFVLSKYIETGVEELDQTKLPVLLTNKYQSLEDAKEILGDVANISSLFIEFQQHLYLKKAA